MKISNMIYDTSKVTKVHVKSIFENKQNLLCLWIELEL